MLSLSIKKQLASLPNASGVYLFKDGAGAIIYIGKAKSLRGRVRSYFQKTKQGSKVKLLQKQVADFEIIITNNEMEAFILEDDLIKKYQPKFNIRLKDDKTYPYLKLKLDEDFPALYKTRLLKNDRARYFGPYTSVESVNRTLKLLRKLFPLRSCKKKINPDQKEARPCLNYHIKRCLGPCIQQVSPQEYQGVIKQVTLFLEGRGENVEKIVQEKMELAAKQQEYELAAEQRDLLKALSVIRERQEVIWQDKSDLDIIGLAQEGQKASLQLYKIRSGRLSTQEHFFTEGLDEEPELVIKGFIGQYYYGGRDIPREIVVPVTGEDQELIEAFLSEEAGHKVVLKVPQAQKKLRLLQNANQNAQQRLQQEQLQEEEARKRQIKDLKSLQQVLKLKKIPEVIEGYDISNIAGNDAVGSMVVFIGGQPVNKYYRRFKIKTVAGSDDFAMLKEVLTRRLQKLSPAESPPPDLILIDGGRGQVNETYQVLKQLALTDLPLLGLAKQKEQIFLPNQNQPIELPRNHKGLQLLQRVRDEAHRFALGYHRQLRHKRMSHSLIEEIPGIGPQKRKALLAYFGSLASLRQASEQELRKVQGIDVKTAKVIKSYLQAQLRI